MSPSPSALICRMTLARLVRRISGSVNSGRGVEVLLGVQPDADAVGDAAAAALALVGAGLRDRLDRQPLDLGAVAVAADAGGAGVDDVLDARDGQRGLGDVRGQHDARCRRAAGRRGAARRARAGRRGAGPRCRGAAAGLDRARSASAVSRISRSPERKTRTSPVALAGQLLDGLADALDLVLGSPSRRRRSSSLSSRGR